MNKITKEAFFFFAGTFIPAAIGFISVPIFTRYFTPAEYGVNALIDTSFGYVNTILFGIISSVVWRYYNEYKKENKVDIFFGLLSIMIRVSLVLIAIITLGIYFFSKYDVYTKYLIIAKAFAVAISAYVSTYTVVLRLDGKAKAFNLITIFNSLAGFLLILFFTKFFAMRNIAMYFSAIVTGIFCCIFITAYYRKSPKTYLCIKETIKILIPILSYAFVALLSNFTQNLLDSSDRYMITLFRDVNVTGLYDKIYGISNKIMAIFSTVFMNLFSPYIYRHLADKDAHSFYKQLMPVYVGIFLPLVLYYSVFSDTICNILLATEYGMWFFIIPCICLGYFFICLSNFAEMILRFTRPREVTIGFVLALLFNLILNALLIPRYDIFGAALGTAASYFFVLIIFSIRAKMFSLEYFFSKNWKTNLLYLIPICECLIYQVVLKRYDLNNIIRVCIAVLFAASYFIPYLYYYFIKNKTFTQNFEEKE